MDKLKTDVLSLCCRHPVRELSDGQTLETFLTLPEYSGDVSRVLTCSVTPVVSAVTVSADGVALEGSCQIRVLYLAQDGAIYAPESSEPFSARLPSSDCDGCRAVDFVWAEDCMARAVSPRKLEIRASLHLVVKCYRTAELSLLGGAEGAGIQLKKQTVPLLLTDDRISGKVTITESLTLPAECADARRILSCRAGKCSYGYFKLLPVRFPSGQQLQEHAGSTENVTPYGISQTCGIANKLIGQRTDGNHQHMFS